MIKVDGPNDLYGQFLMLIQVMILNGNKSKPGRLMSDEDVGLSVLSHAFLVSPYCLERSKFSVYRMAEDFAIYSMHERSYMNRRAEKKPSWLLFEDEVEEAMEKERATEEANAVRQNEKERKEESGW